MNVHSLSEDLLESVSQSQIEDASQYIAQNKVFEHVHTLMGELLINRPDDPKKFMIAKLEEMKGAKLRGQAIPLFTKPHLRALFRIFDAPGRGHITLERYIEAMNDVGAKNFNPNPEGHEKNAIDMETFVEEAFATLMKFQ
ncbi:hypothetical protein BJ742DRAFT_856022 [Cladochytrium replicatum]|nr:hypothetical protein BJ742DRAFT_856022 [Cladochytrium replicatum]